MYKGVCVIAECRNFNGYCRIPGHVPPEVKTTKHIAKVSAKRKKELDAGKDADQEKWFAYVASVIRAKPFCWNCSAPIPEAYYKHASAHILPKRDDYGFPSVAKDYLNFLVLGAGCGCHYRYDSSWSTAETMPIFKMAKERFRLFEKNIAEEERQRIPECFLTPNDF